MKATSSYTKELIEKRLMDLRARPDTPEVRREIEYLVGLKSRHGW